MFFLVDASLEAVYFKSTMITRTAEITRREEVERKNQEYAQKEKAFFEKLEPAIKAAGFVVTHPRERADGSFNLINVGTEQVKNYLISIHFDRLHMHYSSMPCGSALVYRPGNYGRPVRYKKIDEALLESLVARIQKDVAEAVARQNARIQYEANQASWEARRKEELKGVAVPLGLKINILTDGPDAGMYTVTTPNGSDTLTPKPLTASEVSSLAHAINTFAGTAKMFVVTGAINGQPQVLNGYWSQYHVRPGLYSSQEEAAAAIVTVSQVPNSKLAENIRVISFTEYAAIG